MLNTVLPPLPSMGRIRAAEDELWGYERKYLLVEDKVSRIELLLDMSVHVWKSLQRERLLHTATQRLTHTLLAFLQAFSYRAPHKGEVHLIFIQACARVHTHTHTQRETTDACTCLEGLSATWTQTHKRCTHKGSSPGQVAHFLLVV